MPRIPGRHSAARNRRDRARRRRRPSRFSVLFSFEPDPDNLFLRPGDVAGPQGGPARLWGGKRFRGSTGNLFLVAVLAVVAVAACLGGAALAGVFNNNRVPAPRLVVPVLVPPPVTASATGSPSASPARLDRTGMSPARTPATQPAFPRMSQVPAVTSPAPTAATSGQLAVTVSYNVEGQAGDSFEAEVKVINDGSAAISSWQIVLALPYDQITEVANARGSMSGPYLLLEPPSSGSAIAPGATLRVYLDAQGVQTAPEVCEFDAVTCR